MAADPAGGGNAGGDPAGCNAANDPACDAAGGGGDPNDGGACGADADCAAGFLCSAGGCVAADPAGGGGNAGGDPAVEVCNGIDDDADGVVDEGCANDPAA